MLSKKIRCQNLSEGTGKIGIEDLFLVQVTSFSVIALSLNNTQWFFFLSGNT